MSDDLEAKDPKALEEACIKDINAKPVNFDAALSRLIALRELKKTAIVDRLSRQFHSALIAEGNFDGLVTVLSVQAGWFEDSPAFGEVIPMMLKRATRDRSLLAFVDSCKFGKIKPSESFRRLALLRAMKPGDFFVDKTWGFGIIKRIDAFYKRLTIDFTAKAGHEMSLEYAAEALKPVSGDHLLARFHNNPAEVADDVAHHAERILRSAIESFGPCTVLRLQGLLDEYGIVKGEKNWKTFWEKARTRAKSDKFIAIPARRSEPITIRKRELVYNAAWFDEDLRNERNIPKLFEIISAYENSLAASAAAEGKDFKAPHFDEACRKVLTDRLNFAIDGAFLYPPPMFTRLILMAQRLNVETPRSELIEKLMDEDRYMEAGDKLSAKEAEELVRFIIDVRPEASGILLEKLPDMSFNLTCKTLDVLKGISECLPGVQARCRDLLAASTVPPALLVWTIRNWAAVKDWGLPDLYELMEHAIAINEDHTLAGEKLRLQHLLHGFYADKEWFRGAFTSLKDLQREAIFYRIYGNTEIAEPKLLKDLTDIMIEVAPALADKKKAISSAAKKEPPAIRYTSWRTLSERQEAFKHLVDVEIPKNREDIAYARGLGDLRENFEYQSAKDTQRVLMARREEYDRDLRAMHGTDFSDADTSMVGMGVTVVLACADGTELTYTILGEWDADEKLGIIPNRAKVATNLAGKRIGETGEIPTAEGDTLAVTVKDIKPLSAEIRAWLAIAPAAADNAARP